MSNFFRIYKRAPAPALQVPPEPLLLPYMSSQFHYAKKQSMKETNVVRAIPSKEMKDYLLQAAEIRCMGPTFESLLASDRT